MVVDDWSTDVVGTLATEPVGPGAANPTGDVVDVTLVPPAGMVVVVPVAGTAPGEMAVAPVLAAAMGGASPGDGVLATGAGALVKSGAANVVTGAIAAGPVVAGPVVAGPVVAGVAVAARAGCRPGLDHMERVVTSPGLANSASRTVKTDPPAAAAASTHTIVAGTVNPLRRLR